MNWASPDNWLDLVAYGWYGLVLIAIAAVPSLLAMKTHKSIKTETTVIRDQLVNGHTSPLRADVDKAIAAIEALSHDVRGLRADLADEADRRRTGVSDLREEVRLRINEINRRNDHK